MTKPSYRTGNNPAKLADVGAQLVKEMQQSLATNMVKKIAFLPEVMVK